MTHPDCRRARELAALAPDGTLAPFESASLTQHLDGCPDCRAFADTVRWLHHAIARQRLEAAPPIQRRLQARLRSPRAPRRRALLAAAAAAVTCLVALSGGAGRDGEPTYLSSPVFAALYGVGDAAPERSLSP